MINDNEASKVLGDSMIQQAVEKGMTIINSTLLFDPLLAETNPEYLIPFVEEIL
jgi:hypothetical protein